MSGNNQAEKEKDTEEVEKEEVKEVEKKEDTEEVREVEKVEDEKDTEEVKEVEKKEDTEDTKEVEKEDKSDEVKTRAALTRTEVDEEFKELYELVSKKVKQTIANGKLTPDVVRPLLLIVVEEVENFTRGKYDHIDGPTKKAYAMAVTRYVFEDLHETKQIDDETYEWVMLGLEFFSGAIFDGLKALYNTMVDVAEDVSENGCAGCFGRNCGKGRRKRKLKR